MSEIILSLFDHSHVWGSQYEDEFEVVYIDIDSPDDPQDVRLMQYRPEWAGRVAGIILQPPCTEFAGSGARWWRFKPMHKLLDALALVDAGLRQVQLYNPRWWVLENPSGRLSRYLGKSQHSYQPNEYGDPYTKRTCLWGHFTMPQPGPVVEATEGSKMHLLPPGPDRARLRAVTPEGFASAFRRYNV